MEVRIPRHLVNQVLEHAQASPDKEVCGLISGQDCYPRHCYPVLNRAANPKRQFLMDPAQQIDIMREMRERGETLFAIYHSHPDSPAIPSMADIEQAAYPGAVHLIVSMATPDTPQLNGFTIQAKKATAVEIMIDELA